MRVVLLTRDAPHQVYCANALYARGALSQVLIEAAPVHLLRRRPTGEDLSVLFTYISHPARALRKARNLFMQREYYGNRLLHNRRILQDGYAHFLPSLPVASVRDVNSEQCVEWVREHKPDLVYVFGTRFIKRGLMAAFHCPVVNMHWGWSPSYRGEGIVSALANGGTKDLGVTIHLLNQTVDGGDILYQERPQIDRQDNFYSIGLKLAKIGTELFIRVYDDFVENGRLAGMKQDLSRGRLYSRRVMVNHPELYLRAWKNLKAEQRAL